MPYIERRRGPGPWLNIARWSLGGAALAATVAYGWYKGGYMAWVGLPLGLFMMVCVAEAFVVPTATLALVAVAFIYGMGNGLADGIRNACVVLVAVGLFMAAWRAAARLRRRSRRREI